MMCVHASFHLVKCLGVRVLSACLFIQCMWACSLEGHAYEGNVPGSHTLLNKNNAPDTRICSFFNAGEKRKEIESEMESKINVGNGILFV